MNPVCRSEPGGVKILEYFRTINLLYNVWRKTIGRRGVTLHSRFLSICTFGNHSWPSEIWLGLVWATPGELMGASGSYGLRRGCKKGYYGIEVISSCCFCKTGVRTQHILHFFSHSFYINQTSSKLFEPNKGHITQMPPDV